MIKQRISKTLKNARRIKQLTKVEGKNSKKEIGRIAIQMEAELEKIQKELDEKA